MADDTPHLTSARPGAAQPSAAPPPFPRFSTSISLAGGRRSATLRFAGHEIQLAGRWIDGGPWDRFGLYDHYVAIRADGAVMQLPAHAGDIVPGSTEDLDLAIRRHLRSSGPMPAPMTVELDTTYACASHDCGGCCFSAEYRSLAPRAAIPTPLLEDAIREFATAGGAILRFDGGGDPLMHPAVRNGTLPTLGHRLGLKTTILTSGDLLHRMSEAVFDADCYLRLSLNAATDAARRRFHGNRSSVTRILARVEQLAARINRSAGQPPIGATYLLADTNYREVFECARLAKEAGIEHFSARRVLGPATMRPTFTDAQQSELVELLDRVRTLADDTFRVFLPWRPPAERDLAPESFAVASCWQSTFKTVIEPDPVAGGFRSQLCGRYRGGGIGQLQQMPPLFTTRDGRDWTSRWRASFAQHPVSRSDLPSVCVSCIDRGFIVMMDRLLGFLGGPSPDFRLLHLRADGPRTVETWDPVR